MEWLTLVKEAIKIGVEGYKFGRALKAQGEAAQAAEIVGAMHRKYEAARTDAGLPDGLRKPPGVP